MFTSCNFYRYLCQENDVVALVLPVSDAAPLCPSTADLTFGCSGLQDTLARFYGQGPLLHGLTLSLQNFNCLFQADNGGPLSRRPCTALSCPPRPVGAAGGNTAECITTNHLSRFPLFKMPLQESCTAGSVVRVCTCQRSSVFCLNLVGRRKRKIWLERRTRTCKQRGI